MRILGRSDYTELEGDKYDYCNVCGPLKYRAIIQFDSGSVAPTVGETVTGATSSDTGVVEFAQLTGGSYAGGDASGVMILASPSGYDSNTSRIFSDNEHLNGGISGVDFADVNGQPGVSRSGRMHQDRNLIDYNGLKYCREHFKWMFKKEWEDEAEINIDENERGR